MIDDIRPALSYGDDQEYVVELHDRVELRLDGAVLDGVIKAIHPRSEKVTVRYEEQYIARKTGETRTRIRRARFPIDDVDLVARDG